MCFILFVFTQDFPGLKKKKTQPNAKHQNQKINSVWKRIHSVLIFYKQKYVQRDSQADPSPKTLQKSIFIIRIDIRACVNFIPQCRSIWSTAQ